MSDSKITPVSSSSVSAPSAGTTATPITQRTGGLAEALLNAAPVKDAPPEYRNAVDGLRVEGRVVSSNPQTGDVRIATPAGDITIQSKTPLPPDAAVSVELFMRSKQELANVALLRPPAPRQTPDNVSSPPPARQLAPPPQPPLKPGDAVIAIRVPDETPPEPQEAVPAGALARAATIIENLGPADVVTLPQPLPLSGAALAKLAMAPDISTALQSLPPEQQKAILDYLSRPDVAAKLQNLLPPLVLSRTAPVAPSVPATQAPPEVIDSNTLDIVKAQAEAKMSLTPAADAPKAAPSPLGALRGLLPLVESMQSQGAGGLAPRMAAPPQSGNPFASQMPDNVYQLKIISITPPVAAPVQNARPSLTPEIMPAQNMNQLAGEVESITPNGFPVVRVGGDLYILKNTGPLPVGTKLVFSASELSPREVMDSLTPSTWGSFKGDAAKFQPLLDGQWPALQDALQNLGATDAAAALRNTIPDASPKLVPAAMFFLAALRLGDIENWIGAPALKALKDGGKQALVDKLTGDFARIAAQSKETIAGDWRAISLPFLNDEQLSQIQLFLRRQQHDQDGQKTGGDDKTATTRFVLNVNLSRMGAMQLDGLMQKKRLDIILRSQEALAFSVRQDLMQNYAKGLAQTGLEGGISFQTKAQNWVTIELPSQGATV